MVLTIILDVCPDTTAFRGSSYVRQDRGVSIVPTHFWPSAPLSCTYFVWNRFQRCLLYFDTDYHRCRVHPTTWRLCYGWLAIATVQHQVPQVYACHHRDLRSSRGRHRCIHLAAPAVLCLGATDFDTTQSRACRNFHRGILVRLWNRLALFSSGLL